MRIILLSTFFTLFTLLLRSQCTVTTVVNQTNTVNCNSTELTFMGYATGSCVPSTYTYSWQAFAADATGAPVVVDSLTASGSAISGTTIPAFSVPISSGESYVQICLTVVGYDMTNTPVGTANQCYNNITLASPIVVTAQISAGMCGQQSCLSGVLASGGSAPYTYLVSDGSMISPTTLNCFDVPGTYVLTAVDANGCSGDFSFSVIGGGNGDCAMAVPLANGVTLSDTLCALNMDTSNCANFTYGQEGWYSFNSADYTHVNIGAFIGYYQNAAGTSGYQQPFLLEIYSGDCGALQLAHCHNSTVDGGCFDLANDISISPNTNYYIRVLAQWTSWVPMQILLEMGNEAIPSICGCVDYNSCNYDPGALINDGSCGWSGCMDASACNYQSYATCDNGSCVYGTDLTGFLYHDINGDGNYQSWGVAPEYELANLGSIEIPQLNVVVYPDADGHFLIPDLATGTYSLIIHDDSNIWQSAGGDTIWVTLPTCTGLDIPMQPVSGAAASITSSVTFATTVIHCVGGMNPGIWIQNTGSVPFSGTFTMVVPNPLVATALSSASNFSAQSGDTLIWNIVNQAPGTMVHYQCHVAGPGSAFVGQQFAFDLALELVDATGSTLYQNDWTTTAWVTCSYDPNDKQAEPAGLTDAHYIGGDESIEYLVRFQNTGNAVAFDVRIEDEIDLSVFDFSTFEPVGASHSYSTVVYPDGMVHFVFNDIMLPDSTTDEPGSHGWVRYRITPISDLTAGTTLNNTAAIYFDDNEPVITNTYTHTKYDCSLLAPWFTGNPVICANDVAYMSGFDPMATGYAWYLNGTLVSTDANYAFASDMPGEYAISCERTTPFCASTSEMTLTNAPLPGTTLTLTTDGLEAPAGAEWIWYVNGVQVVDQSGQWFNYNSSENAEIWVITISANGCVSQSESFYLIGVNEAERAILAYPNPADAFYHVQSLEALGEVTLYGVHGEVVMKNNCFGMQHSLDTSSLTNGTYILEIKNAQGTISGYSRLVVCH